MNKKVFMKKKGYGVCTLVGKEYLKKILILPQRGSPGNARRTEPIGRRPYQIFLSRHVTPFHYHHMVKHTKEAFFGRRGGGERG